MVERKLILKGKKTKNTARGEITTLWLDNESIDWDYAIEIKIKGFDDEIQKFMELHDLKDIGFPMIVSFTEKGVSK